MDTDESIEVETAEAAPTVAPGVKKTVEEWAAAKGMLNRIAEQPNISFDKRRLAPGRLNEKFADFHRARASHAWPVGAELTEAEFDAAVVAAKSHVFR